MLSCNNGSITRDGCEENALDRRRKRTIERLRGERSIDRKGGGFAQAKLVSVRNQARKLGTPFPHMHDYRKANRNQNVSINAPIGTNLTGTT
jgi:hypothetical protein